MEEREAGEEFQLPDKLDTPNSSADATFLKGEMFPYLSPNICLKHSYNQVIRIILRKLFKKIPLWKSILF